MIKATYFQNAFEKVSNINQDQKNWSIDNRFLGQPDGRPAYAYVRVANIRNGLNSSAVTQFTDIHNTAIKDGFNVTWNRVFFDISGQKNMFNRPGIKSMLLEINNPKNNGGIILVSGLPDFTQIESDKINLGELCINSGFDVLTCGKKGYLLSMWLRVMSKDTTLEVRIKLLKIMGFYE